MDVACLSAQIQHFGLSLVIIQVCRLDSSRLLYNYTAILTSCVQSGPLTDIPSTLHTQTAG